MDDSWVYVQCKRTEFGFEATATANATASHGPLKATGISEGSAHRAIRSASRQLRRKIRHNERQH